MNLELQNIQFFLENSFQTNPITQLRIVHVGGTNGKGSVCSLISSVLYNSGYKVGTFNSPHFIEPRDAIRINNNQISYKDHIRIRKDILEKTKKIQLDQENNQKMSTSFSLSNFETSFAEMLIWFVENKVDIAVLEVGVGGRRDATNVFDYKYSLQPDSNSNFQIESNNDFSRNSLVQCICSIGPDHFGLIGNSLAEIAVEKMGIARHNSVLIVGQQAEESVLSTINEQAKNLVNKTVIDASKGWELLKNDQDLCLNNQSICSSSSSNPKLKISINPQYLFNDKKFSDSFFLQKLCSTDSFIPSTFDVLPLVLNGSYQAQNAAIAFYALLSLSVFHNFNKITLESIEKGYLNTRWPGRLTWIQLSSKLDNDCHTKNAKIINFPSSDLINSSEIIILVDGAHNPPAASELKKYVDYTQNEINKKSENVTLNRKRWIVGFTAGKNIKEIFSILWEFGSNDELWIVPFNQPEEMPWINSMDPNSIRDTLLLLHKNNLERNQNELDFNAEKDTSVGNSSRSVPNIKVFNNISDILKELFQSKEKHEDGFLNIVCGSLYLVSDLFRELDIEIWKDFVDTKKVLNLK
ncbi:hypothetical protein BB558_002302 [Smittium angustum]|uniref:Mur ligase central domain-containing protein n=1 Tax=Smittium angustum TaxID=133377 RepID=A0A2U1J984_SMIAN|nr:hypothetical protein BB558_002302 [Smittium angustum]